MLRKENNMFGIIGFIFFVVGIFSKAAMEMKIGAWIVSGLFFIADTLIAIKEVIQSKK